MLAILNRSVVAATTAALAMGVVPGIAAGQSTTNFDTLSTGTVITTQYLGVTFSGVGGSGSCTIAAVDSCFNATDNCSGGGNSAEYTVSVDAGCAADFNHSGTLEVQDIFDYLTSWFTGCP